MESGAQFLLCGPLRCAMCCPEKLGEEVSLPPERLKNGAGDGYGFPSGVMRSLWNEMEVMGAQQKGRA